MSRPLSIYLFLCTISRTFRCSADKRFGYAYSHVETVPENPWRTRLGTAEVIADAGAYTFC